MFTNDIVTADQTWMSIKWRRPLGNDGNYFAVCQLLPFFSREDFINDNGKIREEKTI